MNNRKQDHSRGFILFCYLGALLSLLLLVPTGAAVLAEAGSFRSCSTNSSGLLIADCGKHGLNQGDLIILLLFLGATSVVISLWTHAVRVSKASR